MKTSKWLLVGAVFCAAFLSACGGGGGSTSPFVPVPSGPVATSLDVSSNAVQLGNTASAKVTITVTALDSGKRAVADVDVTIAVAAGSDAVVTQAATKTDAQGKVTADVTVGANKANRAVTITATAGALTKSTTLQVTGAKITSTLSAAVLPPSPDPTGTGTVRYRVVDQANNPMPGQAVSISAASYDPPSATGTTDINGEYVYSFKTPTVTGAYVIDAVVAGATNQVVVNVQSAGSVASVTQDIISVALTASPSVVPVNVTGTQNRSEIRAIFLGDFNVPIKNIRVKFYLDDPFGVGGSFTSNGDARPLYTDSNGIITTSYIPGSRPSPTEGVVVRICYSKTDAELANFGCPDSKIVTLTVIDDPLGVTIGTDGLIEINTARLTYVKKYVVQVVDSAGNPKADINVSAVVDLPRYYKGRYTRGTDSWVISVTEQCNSEDSNRNNSIDLGEDLDNDSRLDPGKSDVQVRLLETKTGVDGLALLQIEYPQNYGSWVAARITVAASGILGTEGRASFLDDAVPVPASVVKNIEATPPFVVSPYGTLAGTTATGGPCTNPD